MEKWSVNETLLQSYRSCMLSSQAFLLAVAAIFYGKSVMLEMACAVLALVQLWYIWFRVISSRSLIVDFYKFNLASSFNECGEKDSSCEHPLTRNTYLKNKSVRKTVNRSVENLGSNWRPTRLKIDIFLPISFSIMWVLIVIQTMVDLFQSAV